MPDVRAELIRRARRRCGAILPCGSKANLADCFSVIQGRLALWFNTPDGTSHVEIEQAMDDYVEALR